jgi:hypothetical protein
MGLKKICSLSSCTKETRSACRAISRSDPDPVETNLVCGDFFQTCRRVSAQKSRGHSFRGELAALIEKWIVETEIWLVAHE